MPSLDATTSPVGLVDQERILLDFAIKIDNCITDSAWENLSTVLESRQKYLDQLFLGPIPEGEREWLKQLAESVLQQDEVFQTKIQLQKEIAVQQQMAIERGRRAINAYTNQ